MQVVWFLLFLRIPQYQASDVAKRLYDDLMSKYDKRVRPVFNATDTLTVGINLSVSQLIDVDEKNQIMTSNVWLKHEWRDYRLKWDPSLYDNICIMYIPSEELWLPDIALYNNADGKYHITLMTKASVYPTGAIIWDPPMLYKSSCPINVQYFPFDEQVCSLKFGSWTHDGSQLNLTHIIFRDFQITSETGDFRSQGVYFRDYYPNGEWDIIRAPATRNHKRYSCCPQPYYDITYQLILKRKTLFYTVHLIIPCVSISLLTLVVFYLPSQSSEKIVLCISIDLSLTVFFLLLADLIPSTSIIVPLLGKYLLFTMCLVTLSILNTIAVLAVHHHQQKHERTMPLWMKHLFVHVLPPFVLLSTKQFEQIDTKSRKVKRMHKLPQDDSLDAIFARMLERILHLGEIEKIFDKFQTAVREDKAARDWQYVALVLDRILLLIFTVVSLTGTVGILAQAPGNPIPSVDLTNLDYGVLNACNYTHEY